MAWSVVNGTQEQVYRLLDVNTSLHKHQNTELWLPFVIRGRVVTSISISDCMQTRPQSPVATGFYEETRTTHSQYKVQTNIVYRLPAGSIGRN
jgi:hypothetical protein